MKSLSIKFYLTLIDVLAPIILERKTFYWNEMSTRIGDWRVANRLCDNGLFCLLRNFRTQTLSSFTIYFSDMLWFSPMLLIWMTTFYLLLACNNAFICSMWLNILTVQCGSCRWTFLRQRRPTASPRSAKSTPCIRSHNTRRGKIAWLLRESVVMTGNSQVMVVRPSLSSTKR